MGTIQTLMGYSLQARFACKLHSQFLLVFRSEKSVLPSILSEGHQGSWNVSSYSTMRATQAMRQLLQVRILAAALASCSRLRIHL
ncbi:MAG: hypothetical protein JWS10_4170 [Cypionkella sp.]|nr:hypothetical protein [Cypionkella sp.]